MKSCFDCAEATTTGQGILRPIRRYLLRKFGYVRIIKQPEDGTCEAFPSDIKITVESMTYYRLSLQFL